MNKPFGPALMSCIKQNDKFSFEGLSRDHSNPEHHHISEFQSLARDVSIPWHQIYYAIFLTEKHKLPDPGLIRWFIIHILYQSGSGHMRSDLGDFEESLDKWFYMEREYFPGTDKEFESNNSKISEIRRALLDQYRDILEKNGNIFGNEDSSTPFIYQPEKQIVYLRKFFKMEKHLLRSFDILTAQDGNSGQFFGKSEIETIVEELNKNRTFDLSEKTVETMEKLQKNRLIILSGGPGTGKTTTVTALLRIQKILEKKNPSAPVKRIRLVAPTGRAANRMIESINGEMKNNPVEGIDALLPEKAYTLHKLLGIRPARKDVQYNKSRPIPAELIILDEASMVDARLMSLLLDALSPSASILLVGDKDQLPSVDAGAVFGDIVYGADARDHKLSQSIVILEKSWRSSSEILQIAQKVISGAGDEALQLLKKESDTVLYRQLPPLDKLVLQIMERYKTSEFSGSRKRHFPMKDPQTADKKKIMKIFNAFEDFALLIPTRRGEYGVERINNRINQLISGKEQTLYHGQPLMIRINDYNLSLFNGDRGVILNFGGEFYAVFRDGPDEFRFIPAGKLNSFETAYAQTIHKSQGSEFREVMVLIPEGSERLLTREIVYTGITRAKGKLTILSTDSLFTEAVSRVVVRHSGIRDYLGGVNDI